MKASKKPLASTYAPFVAMYMTRLSTTACLSRTCPTTGAAPAASSPRRNSTLRKARAE